MAQSQDCTGCFLVASPYLADGHFFRSVVFIVRHSVEGAFGVIVNHASEQRFSEVVELSDPSWEKSPEHSTPESSSTESLAGATQKHATDAKNAANPTNRDLIHRDLIHLGGPVDGPLLALHNIAGIGEPCGVSDEEMGSHGSKTTVNDHPAEAYGSMSIQWSDVPAWMTADEEHLRVLARRGDAKLKFIVGYSGWGAGQLEDELDAGGWLVTPADADSIFGDDEDVWEKLVKRCGHAILQGIRPDLAIPPESASFDPGMN